MTNSGQWEIWHKGDGFRVRHCIGHYPSKRECDKAWKRLTMFAPPKDANKYELLEPNVKQQLEAKQRSIEEKGRQVSTPHDTRTFQQILTEKADKKRKQYAYIERMEREGSRVDHSIEKERIRGGIAAIKWVLEAYTEWSQQEMFMVK